ncbi:MAG: glycoside hydrolase family 3 protein [Thermotogae bacterium]|nr:glycoside hydrolase family 3 protein [Thermotogota bacterium]
MIVAGFESLDELRYLISKKVPGLFIPSWMGSNTEVFRIIHESNYEGIVCTDNEGGYASWVVKGYPSPAEVGRMLEDAGNYRRVYDLYRDMAYKLRTLGINLNLAPVVDLYHPDNYVIGGKGRAYSHSPDRVIVGAELFRKAHEVEGVGVVFKHFVGQGRSVGDPHDRKSIYPFGWEQLNEDLKPFSYFITTGARYIMVSHVSIPILDEEFPISLSKKIISGLLREKLGFSGKVITDDIRMSAVEEEFGFEEAVRLSLEAGVDYVLISRGMDRIEWALRLMGEL